MNYLLGGPSFRPHPPNSHGPSQGRVTAFRAVAGNWAEMSKSQSEEDPLSRRFREKVAAQSVRRRRTDDCLAVSV